ncbi:hypothetical protein P7C70_g1810, partial [Phenoliferia sp. Uapishka_3]
MSVVPTATYVSESAVIAAPLSQVWTHIKLGNFSSWWSKIAKSGVGMSSYHQPYCAQSEGERDQAKAWLRRMHVGRRRRRKNQHDPGREGACCGDWMEADLNSSPPREAKDISDETDVFTWEFKDGQVLTVKQEEHSSLEHSITYSVISAAPALTYTSVVSTIRLYPVTSGANAGSTFVTWSGSFSSDADAGVIEDARFKRAEALADLAAKSV